jgi:hypothetical protein
MASRTKPKRASSIPDGFAPLDNSAPQTLEMEPGDEVTGTLGQVIKAKDPTKPDYRTIKTADGRFYLPSRAGLMALMDLPSGSEVYIRLDGGQGNKKSPYQYTVAVRNGNGAEDEVPF